MGVTAFQRRAEGRGRRVVPDSGRLTIPHAVGFAYSIKQRDAGELVIVVLGDGATSQGDFHEAINIAGVFELPVVFVWQESQWAISPDS